MAVMRCPKCEVVLTHDEARSGTCPACQASFAPPQTGGENAFPEPWRAAGTRSSLSTSGNGHTNRCDALLPPEYRGRFPVLAMVMEKASILWAVLLSPLIWAFLNKHYALGYDADSRTLYLFRLSLGLFGAGPATGVQKYPLDELRDLTYRNGLLTARLSFRRDDGSKISLFMPLPSRRNARAVYDSMQQGSAAAWR